MLTPLHPRGERRQLFCCQPPLGRIESGYVLAQDTDVAQGMRSAKLSALLLSRHHPLDHTSLILSRRNLLANNSLPMSLSPEHQAALEQLQAVLPSIQDALFPVVQDALIRPLWVPVALNCICLLAIFATMGYVHFFSGSKLQFLKVCDVRNVRLAIPTVE